MGENVSCMLSPRRSRGGGGAKPMTLCLTLIQHSWQLRSPRAGKERGSHKGLCDPLSFPALGDLSCQECWIKVKHSVMGLAPPPPLERLGESMQETFSPIGELA